MPEQFTVRGIGGDSTMNRPAYEDYQERLNSRLAEGRYTLEEAALTLCDATGERPAPMLKKLMQAVRDGVLPVYEPGRKALYTHGDDFSTRVREFYEEARWRDLNKWLADNEPLIEFEFPAPSGALEKNEPPAPVGIPSAEIIEKFRLGKEWKEKLRKPDRNKFLMPPVLAQRGQRGGEPHRWNPARFGEMLIAKYGRNQKAVSEVIYRHFTGYSDAWDAILSNKEKGIF